MHRSLPAYRRSPGIHVSYKAKRIMRHPDASNFQETTSSRRNKAIVSYGATSNIHSLLSLYSKHRESLTALNRATLLNVLSQQYPKTINRIKDDPVFTAITADTVALAAKFIESSTQFDQLPAGEPASVVPIDDDVLQALAQYRALSSRTDTTSLTSSRKYSEPNGNDILSSLTEQHPTWNLPKNRLVRMLRKENDFNASVKSHPNSFSSTDLTSVLQSLLKLPGNRALATDLATSILNNPDWYLDNLASIEVADKQALVSETIRKLLWCLADLKHPSSSSLLALLPPHHDALASLNPLELSSLLNSYAALNYVDKALLTLVFYPPDASGPDFSSSAFTLRILSTYFHAAAMLRFDIQPLVQSDWPTSISSGDANFADNGLACSALFRTFTEQGVANDEFVSTFVRTFDPALRWRGRDYERTR